MPIEIWSKLITDLPILFVLILVLVKGGEKFDKFGEKFDKLGEKVDKLTSSMRSLGGKVELIGKVQDVRLDLHEERITETGKHQAVTTSVAAAAIHMNGAAPTTRRPPHASWPDTKIDEDEG